MHRKHDHNDLLPKFAISCEQQRTDIALLVLLRLDVPVPLVPFSVEFCTKTLDFIALAWKEGVPTFEKHLQQC